MPKQSEELVEIPGQDSFLDVITNIVGILILLVLIVGIKTSRTVASAVRAEASAEHSQVAAGDDHLSAAYQAAIVARNEVDALIRRSLDVRRESQLREEERNLLATFVSAGEKDIELERARLSADQQRDFDLRRQLADAQKQLEHLSRMHVSLLGQESQAEVVENLPTPLAKTVTGDEVHLRLAQGRVAVVPIAKLHDEAEPQLERNVWRLRDQGLMEGAVGPVDGFRMLYRVRLIQVAVPTRSGIDQIRPVIQEKYEYVPVSSAIGEPISEAVRPNSGLLQALRRSPPATTTVTIWTYPDSFDEFRTLKKALFDLGYAAAGRPLPEGIPISSSPSGTKSAAQ